MDANKIKNLSAIIMLTFGLSLMAHADVWKWVDEDGKVNYVDSDTPIYTWVDESGKRHYSDTPDHEDAVSVELVWHSEGNLDDVRSTPQVAQGSGGGMYVDPEETPEERHEREQAEAYYCKRAKEIYNSYLNAPRLYKTHDDGTREYLSEEELAATIADTEAKVAQLCREG